MTPEAVAETGHDAFRDDRTLVVPGWPYKAGPTKLGPSCAVHAPLHCPLCRWGVQQLTTMCLPSVGHPTMIFV